MANYATLKAAIQNVVKTNGNNEITGALLQQSLLSMITSLGAGYQFVGVATPSTNPGTPDQNVMYFAATAGTYSNFGGIVVNDGETCFLCWNGSWTKKVSGAATTETMPQGIFGLFLDATPTRRISITTTGTTSTSTVRVVMPSGYYFFRNNIIKSVSGVTLTSSAHNYYFVAYDPNDNTFHLYYNYTDFKQRMTLMFIIQMAYGTADFRVVGLQPVFEWNGVMYEPFSKSILPTVQSNPLFGFGAYLDTRDGNIITITRNNADITVTFPSGYYLTKRGVSSLTGKTITISTGSYKTAYYDHTLNDFVVSAGIVAGEDKTNLFIINTGWTQTDLRNDVRIIGIQSVFILNNVLYYPQSPNVIGINNNFGKVEIVGQSLAIGETFDIASAEIFNVNDNVLMEKLYHSKRAFLPNGTIGTTDSTSYWTIIIPVYLLRNVVSFTWDAGVEKIINGYNANYEFVKNYRSYSVPESTLTVAEIVNDGCAYISLCYRVSQVSGKYIRVQHSQIGASGNIFCSSSLGNDSNNGETETTPVKTLARAQQLISAGKTLKLKCGDVFYTHTAIPVNGYNVESYGYGELPVITHFMIISGGFTVDSAHGANIWKIDLSTVTVGGAGYDSANNNVGFIYDAANDNIVWGHKVNGFTEADVASYSGAQRKTWLQADGDFLQRDNMLYLYSTVNPNNYEQLHLGGILGGFTLNNGVIKNVKVIGCNFGITADGERKNFIIENVELDLIGGCSKNDGSADFVRWGNGFEFWIGTRTCPANIRVRNCRVSRVFDAGATIQGQFVMTQEETTAGRVSDDAEKAKNVYFSNNVFSRCRQAYEAFSRLYDANGNVVGQYPMENCVFENNICVESGNNEFNSPEIRDTNLLTCAIGMIIRGNAFWGGGVNYRHLTTANFTFGKNNTFYVLPGDVLFNDNGVVYYYPIENDPSTWIGGATTYQQAIDNVISLYRQTIGDQYSKIIGITPDEFNKYADLIRVK